MSESQSGFKRNWYLFTAIIATILVISLAVILVFRPAPQSTTSNPFIPQITPNPPYYLEYPDYPGQIHTGNSSILLVSATASYSRYPFDSFSQLGGRPGAQKGDLCLIVNITLTNDYTVSNPVGPNMSGQNGTTAYLYLTAQIFNQQGLIQANDVTPPYQYGNPPVPVNNPPIPYLGAFIGLDSGETGTTTIYLSREDLSSGMTYAPGRIYVVTEARAVYVLNAETGAKLSYAPTGGQMRSSPTPYNSNLYVGSSDWNLYCFGEAATNSEQNTETQTPQPATTNTPTSSIAPNVTATTNSQQNTTNEAPVSTATYAAVVGIAIAAVAVGLAAVALMRSKKKN